MSEDNNEDEFGLDDVESEETTIKAKIDIEEQGLKVKPEQKSDLTKTFSDVQDIHIMVDSKSYKVADCSPETIIKWCETAFVAVGLDIEKLQEKTVDTPEKRVELCNYVFKQYEKMYPTNSKVIN